MIPSARGTPVQRVPVWSRWLRLAHWAMAGSVLFLLASGWLGRQAPAAFPGWRQAHMDAGWILLAALALRAGLLLGGRGSDRLPDLLPRGPQAGAALAMLRFYLSLGRAPLPAWYAHNPLWGPVYLVWLALLAASVWTGLELAGAATGPAEATVARHAALAAWVGWIAAAHVAAVAAHDLRARSADCSAMIHGERIFELRPPAAAEPRVEIPEQEGLRRPPGAPHDGGH